VLCDRFTDATFAYQGAGRGFDLDVLKQLERWVQGPVQPRLTLWFDLDPAIAMARLAKARRADRFETEDERFFHRVRAGYQARMEADPRRFARIDATQDREQVSRQLIAAVDEATW
jgi:dTMP kinase